MDNQELLIQVTDLLKQHTDVISDMLQAQMESMHIRLASLEEKSA